MMKCLKEKCHVRGDIMIKRVVEDKPIIKCIRRIYEVSSGNKVMKIASNKVIVGDVLDALLREDYELGKFVENFDVLGISMVSITPIKESLPHMREEKEKLPVLAKLPTAKQRRWMILHEMPDDREITQKEWIGCMVKKNYDRRQISGAVSHDFVSLVKLGNLQKVSTGKYKIVDKEVYKDDKKLLESIDKLKKGEKLVLA